MTAIMAMMNTHNKPCLCRWGPVGQGRLLCDLHSALVRVLEGLDEDLMEAPTMAGYGSATDLAPADSYKPLLGAAWPELARRYLQEPGPLGIGQDAVEAALRLKVSCRGQTCGLQRLQTHHLYLVSYYGVPAGQQCLQQGSRTIALSARQNITRAGLCSRGDAELVLRHWEQLYSWCSHWAAFVKCESILFVILPNT